MRGRAYLYKFGQFPIGSSRIFLGVISLWAAIVRLIDYFFSFGSGSKLKVAAELDNEKQAQASL